MIGGKGGRELFKGHYISSLSNWFNGGAIYDMGKTRGSMGVDVP